MSKTLAALLFMIAIGTAFPTNAEPPRESKDELSNETTAAKELADVQGKWERVMRTDGGIYKVVKEHKGNETTVTILDSNGADVVAKKSEFRLEKTGRVRIFTFFNNVITAGPQKGQTDKAPHSYIYRITGDTFVEVNGLLIGDDDEPVIFAWQRVKE